MNMVTFKLKDLAYKYSDDIEGADEIVKELSEMLELEVL